jgi:hypothetical protein
VYLIIRLFAVTFPDAEDALRTPTPTIQQTPGPADGSVIITHLVPSSLPVDSGPTDLEIFGYNFQSTTKAGTAPGQPPAAPGTTTIVTVNHLQRTPKFVSERVVIVALDGSDTATSGQKDVSIVSPGGAEATAALQVVDRLGTLRVLWWNRAITREMQLFLIVLFAGALGSYIHSIRSLTAYIGNQQAVASWFWFYVTTPYVGMAMAVVFYAAIRGGFVAGSPADVKSVNPFGVFAIAAMVGMFADKAGQKLADIFDALFKSNQPPRQNPMSNLTIATASLPAHTANAYTAPVQVTGGKAPYTFSLLNPDPGFTVQQAQAGSDTATISGPANTPAHLTVSVTDAATTTTSKLFTF